MSSFTDPLILSPGKNKLWVTDAPLNYEIGLKGSGLTVTVPSGFQTDLGTIPPIFRPLLNPADAKCAAAFVLHDFLCNWIGFTRTVTDAILFEALLVLGVPRWKVSLIYLGVSIYRIATHKT